MGIDLEHLRRALLLTGSAPPSAAEVRDLAILLDDAEEVLPHLVLKRGAFADSAKLKAALAAAARRLPTAPQTRRRSGLVDWRRLDGAQQAVASALREAIDQDLANQEPAARLNQALGDLAGMQPYGAFDAHLRIRRDR